MFFPRKKGSNRCGRSDVSIDEPRFATAIATSGSAFSRSGFAVTVTSPGLGPHFNALKYGPSPGHVTVTAAPDLQKAEPEVAIAVANRGSAIDTSDLPHLFEPFFRGKNTDGVPGSGLGLYIVKTIMESLGGSVSVSSSEEGTSFTLHIPAMPAGQEA